MKRIFKAHALTEHQVHVLDGKGHLFWILLPKTWER